MKSPCTFWSEEIMPALRAGIARILYGEGFTQAKIAEILDITQAMVSKYLSEKYKKPDPEVQELIDRMAGEIANLILYGAEKGDVIKFVTQKFMEFFDSETGCRAYLKYAGLKDDTFCRELFITAPSRSGVLEMLNLAVGELLNDPKFAELLPEIRSNFVYALPNPGDYRDVAAVPGRITLVKGKLFALPPEFGASRHTAAILIKLSKISPGTRSVLNIRFDGRVLNALKKAGLRTTEIKEDGRDEEQTVEMIAEKFRENEWDAVIDRGAFGIEPVVYIFGRNPIEVLEKLKRVEEFI
ncbi:thiamine-phosphate synthase family protein [Thermococcus sp.]